MNNILCLIGRITKDLELRYTTNNKAVVNIPLAINNGKDDTTFIDVVIYGNIAETTSKYCKKGDLIGVQAKVQNNNWTDKDGKKHYDYKFMGYKVTFLSTKKEENNQVEKTDNTNDPFSEFGEQISIDDNFLD
jgi:single-strand DNA-binding protein